MVVEWVTLQKKGAHQGTALMAIRKTSKKVNNHDIKIFPGIGVYNAPEVLHRAGTHFMTHNSYSFW
jgi:hypothetical protein